MSETLNYELVNKLRNRIILLERTIELKNMYLKQIEIEAEMRNTAASTAPNGGTVVVTELSSANVEIAKLNGLLDENKTLLNLKLEEVSELEHKINTQQDLIESLEDKIKELEHSQHMKSVSKTEINQETPGNVIP